MHQSLFSIMNAWSPKYSNENNCHQAQLETVSLAVIQIIQKRRTAMSFGFISKREVILGHCHCELIPIHGRQNESYF